MLPFNFELSDGMETHWRRLPESLWGVGCWLLVAYEMHRRKVYITISWIIMQLHIFSFARELTVHHLTKINIGLSFLLRDIISKVVFYFLLIKFSSWGYDMYLKINGCTYCLIKRYCYYEKSYNTMIVIALISFILPTTSIMTHLSDLLMFYLLHLSPKQFVPNTNVFYDGRMIELGHIGDNVDLIGPTFSII